MTYCLNCETALTEDQIEFYCDYCDTCLMDMDTPDTGIDIWFENLEVTEPGLTFIIDVSEEYAQTGIDSAFERYESLLKEIKECKKRIAIQRDNIVQGYCYASLSRLLKYKENLIAQIPRHEMAIQSWR